MDRSYYRTMVTECDHYRDDDNYCCSNDTTYEVRTDTIEEMHDRLLKVLKSETKANGWGEYKTCYWSDIEHVTEISEFKLDRADIPGYLDYVKEVEAAEHKKKLEQQQKIQAAELSRDQQLYKELMSKYPNGIPQNA